MDRSAACLHKRGEGRNNMRSSTIAALGLSLFAALPAQAQSDAEPYRAVGTEPFWSLTMDGQRIRYQPADGTPVSVARPRPIIGFNGERYQSRRMTVDITHVECNDGMSDRTFKDTVTVTLGARTLRGCGGTILSDGNAPARTLLEGSWTIQSIGGRPVLARSNPRVTFRGNRMSGSTGCNSFNGSFRFDRGRLTAGSLATTRKACAGPLNTQEQKLLRLVGQRLTVSRNRNGKLVMTARGGQTVVLAPGRR
jgi:heat shock protein HslJ